MTLLYLDSGGNYSGGKKMVEKHQIRTTVNGQEYSLLIDLKKTLLEILRDDLNLTGTKKDAMKESVEHALSSLTARWLTRALYWLLKLIRLKS